MSDMEAEIGAYRKRSAVGESYTGRFFDLNGILPEHISLYDIAHSLALENRYGGHSSVPLSVAEHSFRVALAVEERWPKADERLYQAALLHDAHEAYAKDLPRPLKTWLRQFTGAYDLLCEELQAAIHRELGLPAHLPSEWNETIKWADNALCRAESKLLMRSEGREWNWNGTAEIKTDIRCYGWTDAERAFLRSWERYGGRLKP